MARARWSGALELKRWAARHFDFDQIVEQAIQDRWCLKPLGDKLNRYRKVATNADGGPTDKQLKSFDLEIFGS